MSSLRPWSARRAGRLDGSHQQVRINLAAAEVGVAVTARSRFVPGVVAVHQIDAAGNCFDPIDGIGQRLAGRPGVAGVQAKPDSGVADDVPEPGDGVEAARHRVIAAGGVFQVDGNLGFQPVQRLAPALEALVDVVVVGDVPTVHDHRRCANVGRRSTGLLQDLARRDPHAIVRRRKVDQVGRMHVDGQGRGFQRGGVVPRLGSLPALRIAKENLHYVSAFGLRCGQRIGWADMRTNEHNPSLVRPIW